MILIGNGRLITRDEKNTYLENGCVAVEGNEIVNVASTEEMKNNIPTLNSLMPKAASSCQG